MLTSGAEEEENRELDLAKFWYSFDVPEDQMREREDKVDTRGGVGSLPGSRFEEVR